MPNEATHCARCGTRAAGHAYINGKRYCHGDFQNPSCYELQNWENFADFFSVDNLTAALQAVAERTQQEEVTHAKDITE